MNVLGASDAETFTVGELLNHSATGLDLRDIVLGYGNVKGLDELRESVSSSYDSHEIKPNNVLITLGASEAILLALHTLLDPGDKALVCQPCYQGLYEMAEVTGAKVVTYNYVEGESGFVPDLTKVRTILAEDPAPKVLVLNSPHNPTGHAFDEAALKDLLTLAKSVGTQVVVDEVFSGITIEQTGAVPSAACLDCEAVVIGSLSKVYGLAGLRVGWLVAPAKTITKCKELRYYTSLSPPVVVQQLAKIALDHKTSILKRTQSNVTQNYKFALNWLKTYSAHVEGVRPQAGLVMLLRLKTPGDTGQWVRQLATQCKVFLVPCKEAFDLPEGYLRLGLGGNPEKFQQGLVVVGKFLESGKCSD